MASRLFQLLYQDATLTLLEDKSLICDYCICSSSNRDCKIVIAIFTRDLNDRVFTFDQNDKASSAICFICRNCKAKIRDLIYSQTSQRILCMGCLMRLTAWKKISANGKRQWTRHQGRLSSKLSGKSSTIFANRCSGLCPARERVYTAGRFLMRLETSKIISLHLTPSTFSPLRLGRESTALLFWTSDTQVSCGHPKVVMVVMRRQCLDEYQFTTIFGMYRMYQDVEARMLFTKSFKHIRVFPWL